MKQIITEMLTLEGTHYDIGREIGALLDGPVGICSEDEAISKEQVNRAMALYDRFCPGIGDELRGYADAKGVALGQLYFTFMSHLKPNCSEMALMPEITESGHLILARNYEFAPHLEDFRIYRVAAEGKYAHIGGSVVDFGRSEGINECGFAVSMTSCGMPVSNMDQMRQPAIEGLQFWAIIRTLLDRCKTTDEALELLDEMPIGYNINLLMADADGSAVLFESLDGKKVHQKIGKEAGQGMNNRYLHATNHPVFSPFCEQEPMTMKNSAVRYELIESAFRDVETVATESVKQLLLTPYPNGLNCGYYEAFFGTIKSVILDVESRSYEICWGGNEKNQWQEYSLKEAPSKKSVKLEIAYEQMTAEADFFKMVPIETEFRYNKSRL